MDKETRKAMAQGTYRAPGFVIADERGYDLDLALRSVGPGWAPLIKTLFLFIDAPEGYLGNQKKTPVRVEQVKEKFGTLSFYYSGGDDFFRGAVYAAEALSASICEVCGDKAETRSGGYILTLCDRHHASHQAGTPYWKMVSDADSD